MSAATKNSNSTRNKQYTKESEIDITKVEFDRIKEALKKEEFRKLFLDYVEEIQDPENRKLYEEELKQFEAERGVDVTFINPEPGFVVKTSVDGTLKCFINIAKSTEVAKPSSEQATNPENGKLGLSWSLPLAQAAPRDDIDQQGRRCIVYDVIFHPDTLQMAKSNSAFRKCLIETALDAVEREFKVKLDRANLKYPKLDFKGMARPIVIRKLMKNAPAESMEPHPLENMYPPKPTAETANAKVLPMQTNTAKQPEFSIPNYCIKFRHAVDLGEYTNEIDSRLNMTLPHELIVEIELPLLKSTAECQLDVTAKEVYLQSERGGAKYRLKLDLPHVVNDKEGKARFDTEKRILSITLPVVQPTAAEQRSMHDALVHLNREDSGVESDVREEVNSNSTSQEEEEEDEEEEIETKIDSVDAELKQAEESAASTANVVEQAFLKPTVQYKFPAKFDCNVLDNSVSFVIHVNNVQSQSVAIFQKAQSAHLQFTSIGSGYYPTYYAFYFQLPADFELNILDAAAETWENNIIFNINLMDHCEHLQSFLAGLHENDLQTFNVQEKFKMLQTMRAPKQKSTLTTALNVTVQRSSGEQEVEIAIKPSSVSTINTTEDEEIQTRADNRLAQKKLNKKQKKKGKKRRSLSESACDDIKAYEQMQQNNRVEAKTIKPSSAEQKANTESTDNQKQLTNVAQKSQTIIASSLQERKQRSYSECRENSAAFATSLPTTYKGILKHYSRYDARPSVSDSCSSMEDCSSIPSSVDAAAAAFGLHANHFAHSFSDIPEEQVTAELSESCKKTVRFNEVIKKQIFRIDSSILGQRKKNQKRRSLKQRALQRRLSEGDSADYEDTDKHDFANSMAHKEYAKADSGATSNTNSKGKEKGGKSKRNHNARQKSDSLSDVESDKNALMFEMEHI